MDETQLTRKTIVHILKGIRESKFMLFQKKPEEFIIRIARIINEQKASTVIESITYDVLNERYETEIFNQNMLSGQLGHNAIEAVKHVYDYVITDSKIERNFAETKGSLDSLELRGIEKGKIECARRHFAQLNTSEITYDVVDNYESLMNIVK